MNRHLCFPTVVLQVSHKKIYVFLPIVILLPQTRIFSNRNFSQQYLDYHFSREKLSLYSMTAKVLMKTTVVLRPFP